MSDFLASRTMMALVVGLGIIVLVGVVFGVLLARNVVALFFDGDPHVSDAWLADHTRDRSADRRYP